MKSQRNSGVATSARFGEKKHGIGPWRKSNPPFAKRLRVSNRNICRQPQRVNTHLRGDILLVRLHGVLTAAERKLAQAAPIDTGVILLKQLRATLVETNRPIIEAMVEKLTGASVLSLHHDISTVTGEEVLIFTLGRAPQPR